LSYEPVRFRRFCSFLKINVRDWFKTVVNNDPRRCVNCDDHSASVYGSTKIT
jgi:hypothetical protein